MDEAARELIRTSRIRITELELLSFSAAACMQANSPAEETAAAASQTSEKSIGNATLSTASSRINVTDNTALGLPRAVIRIACSKGTYVRAFARDLGEALGSGAHLDSLQRSASGVFRIENALTVEQVTALLQT